MIFNYHTHTSRCNHANGLDREYIEKAIERGIQTLGFSDHAPYDFPFDGYYSHFRMKKDEAEEYTKSIRALQKEYEKDIRILCGFELEYYPLYHAREMQFLKQFSPDYLLLGQHFVGNEPNGKTGRGNQEEYVSQVIEGLKTGDFLYLAHPDISGFEGDEQAILQAYRRLCENSKELNIPLELNLLGIREKRWYPDERFWKIAGEVGNEVILGTDAHAPEQFLHYADEQTALSIVKKYNLKLMEKSPLV